MLRGKDQKKEYKDDFKDIKEELEDLMDEFKDKKNYKDNMMVSCKSSKGTCSQGKKSSCLEDCLENPAKYSCNVFCKDTDENCYESYKLFNPPIYAKAHIQVQPYKNFFNLDDAIIAGTIFKDLYDPYCNSGYLGGKRSYDE
ncbi:spore coat associated protein CotJA [Caproiciproducens sp. MSJ-32]|uniref:spore coat associated protein CotJA n=1 Tax=Caproiciproducens sp. MSJ-32 TaxID=2841527 RepID=UPI002570AB37|nr:spore coat associated protein CotJA [Caproiciproducens sp. MSJ-32]